MERIIKQLIDIEEKANQILIRANEEKARLNETFEDEVLNMEKEIAEENAKRINALKVQVNNELEKEREAMMIRSKDQLRKLEEHFKADFKSIVDGIYESILQS